MYTINRCWESFHKYLDILLLDLQDCTSWLAGPLIDIAKSLTKFMLLLNCLEQDLKLYMIYLFQIKYFKIILFSTYEIHEQLYLLRCWNSIHGPLSSFQQAVVNASQGYIVLHEREFPNEYTKNPIGQLYLVAICSFYLNFPAH